MILYQELSEAVIGAAIEVHRNLGPGLLESAYCRCLTQEFTLAGIAFETEVELPVTYKGIQLDCGYRLDFVVDKKIVIEVKAVEAIAPIHEAQLMTYLRLSGLRVGLLINFNCALLKNSIVRRVL